MNLRLHVVRKLDVSIFIFFIFFQNLTQLFKLLRAIVIQVSIFITCPTSFEPTHEIMALIALRKRNLQTRMRNHPMVLHV